MAFKGLPSVLAAGVEPAAVYPALQEACWWHSFCCWFVSSQKSEGLSSTMAYLLMFVTLLHLITLAVLFIATMEKSWWVWSSTESSDLWYNCRFDNEKEAWSCESSKETEWLQAVQVLMVLSVVFSCISFLIFLGQLFTMSKGGLFYLTGVCQAFAGVTTFTAALIYTLHNKEILEDSREFNTGYFGFCFFLAWVCVPLLIWSGIMYIHLRKRE
uniref:Epithelial membrane protein 3b (MAM blood group) n=1 Tax=Astyanax mexicanus TaxID=7994 RepID=W5LCL7_ASTMX